MKNAKKDRIYRILNIDAHVLCTSRPRIAEGRAAGGISVPTFRKGGSTMLDRLKFFRKRPSQPRGDTLYRLATLAAVLTVLFTIAFF